MAGALSVTLNGVERTFADLASDTPDALVGSLGLRPDRVAMEVNGEIVARADWPVTILRNGDRIELVHFVGGGLTA